MAQRLINGAVVSCFGDVSLARVVSVDIALQLGARQAEARAVADAARARRRVVGPGIVPATFPVTRAPPVGRVQVGPGSRDS